MQHACCGVAADTCGYPIPDAITELQEVAPIRDSAQELVAAANAERPEWVQEVLSGC